ncbi:hypothetical protein [Streptomyces sp. RKAG337]|uniref:hypothetical protein n=1 Tax=Streptomyces sp. RKAG337 TaxID=2893404 RepID=UPI00203406BB|nr:hypothetical protein [Streptomyces sp. RKAG337]MCM2430959.1 hypothetical protein [Streptomyces sp. RKAG337]
MSGEAPIAAQLLPYGGDEDRWRSETEKAVRLLAAASDTRGGRAGFNAPVGPVQTLERMPWGWIRWGYPLQGELRLEDACPAEIGVFSPDQGGGWRRVLARRVWGRRPAPVVQQIGGMELPAAISLGRLAVVVAAVLLLGPALGALLPAGTALLGAGAIGVAVGWGLPAAASAATRRQVRVLDGAAPHAAHVHRLLAAQQAVAGAAAAAVSEVEELRRAVSVGHRFLWDAVGLVLAADEDGTGLEIVDGYELAYERLGQAAVIALHEQDLLEDRLVGLGAEDRRETALEPESVYRGGRRARLVAQAAPAGVLDEIADGLGELTAGLRHARDVLVRTSDRVSLLMKGDSNEVR